MGGDFAWHGDEDAPGNIKKKQKRKKEHGVRFVDKRPQRQKFPLAWGEEYP
jgi:hypothetical protein